MHTVALTITEDYIPPRARKVRQRDVTFEHAVEIRSYSSAEAPVALRINGERFGLDKIRTDLRGIEGKLYTEVADGVLEPEMRVTNETSRFAAAEEAQESFAEIILIDGTVWKRVGEPVYELSYGRFSDSEYVGVAYTQGPSDRQCFYNAHEAELVREIGSAHYKTIFMHSKIEVLDPSYIKVESAADRVNKLMDDVKAQLSKKLESIVAESDPDGLREQISSFNDLTDALTSKIWGLPKI